MDGRFLPCFFARVTCALCFTLAVLPARAGDYPDRPIRVVIPSPAGGTLDVITRALTAAMSQSLGQPIVVEAKPGADGIIAADAVAKAAPDGYTLLLAGATALSYAPAARKSLPYDPFADFTPVGRVGDFGYFLYVTDSLPASDLSQFLRYVKANPGALNHGSSASTPLLVATMMARSQNLEFAQVSYKGDAQLAPDLLTGRVHFAFGAAGLMPQVRDGKLRVLMTTLPARSPLSPNAPTLAEAGLPALAIQPWSGLFGPGKLPREIVLRLSAALNAALERPDVREQYANAAVMVRTSTPEALAALVREQRDAWRGAAQAAGVKPE